MNITKKERRQRRAVKTRAHIRVLNVARLTVHRTPRHIYAQVFDVKGERVLASASTVQKDLAKDLKITFLPKQLNNPYFTVAQTGAQQAATALGEQLKATGPSDADASSQVNYINTAAQQGQNALLLALLPIWSISGNSRLACRAI